MSGSGESCHRCGGDLPDREWAGDGGFFCPHCGAPQILLPESMRPETAGTGSEPQPNVVASAGTTDSQPREVHWRTAIRYSALVALIGAALTGLGTILGFASFLSFLWVVSGGVLTLSFYQKQKPAARMNARVGFRIGVITGVLMTACLAVALAAAGAIARFGVHRMAEFDTQVQALEQQVSDRMREQQQSPEITDEATRMMRSAEVKGGVAVVYLGILGGVLLLLSAGGGAFAGILGARRKSIKGTP